MEERTVEDGGEGMEILAVDWSIHALLANEMVLSLCSIVLNLLLFRSLRLFSVFHDHLRMLCMHFTVCVVIISCYSFLRAVLAFQSIAHGELILDRSLSCASPFPVPTAPLVLMTILSLFLCIERMYATVNFVHYEHSSLRSVVHVSCFILWPPAIVSLMSTTWPWSTSQPSVLVCLALSDHSSPLQSNIVFFITGIFHCVYTLIFLYMAKLNRYHEVEYVKHNYNSLSSRFQVGENQKTCLVLHPIHLLLSISLFSYLLADSALKSTHAPSLARLEVIYLVFPFFGCAYPALFLTKNAVIRRKSVEWIRSIFQGSPYAMRMKEQDSEM